MSLSTEAGPGGDGASSGSEPRHHDWTDWIPAAGMGVEEDLSERVCSRCGVEQIVPTDSLVSIAVLRPRLTVPVRREAA